MRELVLDLARWFSAGFNPVFGIIRDDRLHQPPQVGAQPSSATVWMRGQRAAR